MPTRVPGLALGAALMLIPSSTPVTEQSVMELMAAPASTGPVKYYIVGPPVNSQPEYLFAIAAATLGDGNRLQEIFDLNEGRLQPHGHRMVDPTRIEPGWVLLLPPDASGPGVMVGDPPVVAPPEVVAIEPRPADRPSTWSPSDLLRRLISAVLLTTVIALVGAALLLLWRGSR
ncbi:LysM peptidoglycan-binding domain-containing protein [Solwaraspora sp. WMMB335]|uniref:LysM peptidoglycan-binding domain-containing protein n=1 Tax=Solwaraspora sp. WMMB335 TaxID=3404118 RepID=UPI003B94C671